MEPTTAPTHPAEVVERPLVDVRDMLVVHGALLRELRLLPAAVAAVDDGDRTRARVVDRHLGLLCDLLGHHHHGEDELLWPVLRPRLPAGAAASIDQAEAQHEEIDAALGRVVAARPAWTDGAGPAERERLVADLRALHALLAEHLTFEESALLPLVAAHLTPEEWGAVGAAGAASTPKSALVLVLGMFAYEADPAVIAGMLHGAPPPVRALVPRLGPRSYRRRARQVYGTGRP